MAKGLRPHHHEYYTHRIDNYYSDEKHCMIKDVTYRCMICGQLYHERYEYRPPPIKGNSNKALNRNKKKYGNRR